MKFAFFLYLSLAFNILFSTNYYLRPSGLASNSGASFNSALNIEVALSIVASSDRIIIQGGKCCQNQKSGFKNCEVKSFN